MYVADASNNRVSVFSQAGVFVRTFGSLGDGAGQFDFPNGVGVSGSGDIYIVDEDNHRIAEFTDEQRAGGGRRRVLDERGHAR